MVSGQLSGSPVDRMSALLGVLFPLLSGEGAPPTPLALGARSSREEMWVWCSWPLARRLVYPAAPPPGGSGWGNIRNVCTKREEETDQEGSAAWPRAVEASGKALCLSEVIRGEQG